MVESLVRPVRHQQAPPHRDDERTAIELSLLLDAVARWSGYDFREYAPVPLKRRIAERMRAEKVETLSGLQELLLHDDEALRRFVFAMSSNPTRIFRPPQYFSAFRQKVVPFLRTYSFARLWFPACWTGEDVYSTAAVLYDEGLLDRCMLYATDMSETALATAREAVYGASGEKEFAEEYRETGARRAIGEICEIAEDGTVRFDPKLQRQIVFSTHNLATGGSLNEFHCIVARAVLPQFGKSLQFRVHNLFVQSLARFGFLCIGQGETLHGTPFEGIFRKSDEAFPLYRRMR
jgi:chemotaxis protein methyltransferase CheR